MTAATLIYLAVSLSALLSAGTLIAFLWSERQARTHERAMAQRLTALRSPSHASARIGGAEPAAIPVRRPFRTALQMDAPELASSPPAVAVSRELVAQRGSATATQAPPSQRHKSALKRVPTLPVAQEENDEMLKQQMAVAAMALGALTACQPMKRPGYQQNPDPKERYEITMTIHDAPGPLTDAVGSMQYLVPDDSCVPETGGPMNPLRINPKKWIRYPIEKVAENAYRAEVWADGMIDEDYYGLGTCKWTLLQTTLSLKGASVRFTPDLTLRELRSQQSKTIYFSKRAYYAGALEGVPYSGSTQRSYFGLEVQDELFTIELTSRRISP